MRLVCVILFAPPSLHRRRLLHHTAPAALFATFRLAMIACLTVQRSRKTHYRIGAFSLLLWVEQQYHYLSMAKKKTVYHCSECGAEYPKWQGFCSQCGVWNSIEEEEIIVGKQDKPSRTFTAQSITASKPVRLGDIEQRSESRLSLGDPELDRVLGGGLVEGSFILLGGEPGIGKSTLILQTILRLPYKTLYVSGEESLSQLKMRADRIGGTNDDCLIYAETNLEKILSTALDTQPQILVIDSIQTIQTELSDSSPGSVSQIRECATALLKYAKTEGVADRKSVV